MTPTVRDSYCRKHAIDESDFAADLLNRTLYPQARLLRPILQWFTHNPFSVDLTYIDCVGRVRSSKQLADETFDFRNQSANRRFLRRVLHCRVSVNKLHHIVKPLLADQTRVPFPAVSTA